MRKLFLTLLILASCQFLFAQAGAEPSSGSFPVGEKLTYTVSFSNFPTAAYGETYVMSVGRYGNRDAVYLQGKFRTNDLVNAAFFTIDETRQTLVASDTGLPLLSKKIFNENGMGREKVYDYKGTSAGYDWLSAIYHLRFSKEATGSMTIQEGDGAAIQAVFKQIANGHIKTAAGEFDVVTYDIQNPTFPELQISFSNDEQRFPIRLAYKHPKGKFIADLASIQDLSPDTDIAVNPQPRPTPPVTAPSVKPKFTPTPYQNNQPLGDDLPFSLGETLSYKLTKTGSTAPFGTMTVQAKDRRQYNGRDSLLLTAGFQTGDPGVFNSADIIRSYVDPETLLPSRTEINFKGPLSQFNQNLTFDQANGKLNDSRASVVEIPVGTHDLLSLAYAIRSFNLRDAKPSKGPGVDTRVAVYTVDGPVILTILPQPEEMIDYQGQKSATQVVFANIGQTQVKLWLSKDPGRLPLRLNIVSSTFSFTADLISVTQIQPSDEMSASPGVLSTPMAAPAADSIPGFPGVSPSQVRVITANPTLDPNIKKP
jgi:hypothetical protein